jgi:hypothetical protein
MADTKKGLYEELDLRIQGTQVEIETTRHEFRTQLAEVEALSEHGYRGRTGTGVGAAQAPNFDGLTSRAVVRRQFDTVAEQSCWAPPLERRTKR